MKAVGLTHYLPIDNPDALKDLTLETPTPGERDLLVAVKAISVNPVDTKVRAPKETVETSPRILGWDAVGEVIDTGAGVTLFKKGDRVYYAGDITRAGSNSEFQLVDERIVGHAPQSLGDAEAAALPLTGITAWEALFDRLGISAEGKDVGKSILVIGGAGGVGSIAIQLAKKIARLHVIATASRPQSREWVKKLGADDIFDHTSPLDGEWQKTGSGPVDYILCLNSTDRHWRAMAEIIAPQGRICSIVETPAPVDLDLLKSKSASFAWEFMFTRSMYQTADMIEQHHLLNAIAREIDNGTLLTTASENLSPINAENLRRAHALIEQGHTVGKITLSDW